METLPRTRIGTRSPHGRELHKATAATTSPGTTTSSSTVSCASCSTRRTSAQRVEQAAVKLGFVEHGLSEDELDDLVNLAVNGEIREPLPLGDHVNARWQELVGPADRSLVHWLRRLVFRSAWLDQRVKEGELDIVFREDTQSFGYLQRDRDAELIELAPEPSWEPAAYRR